MRITIDIDGVNATKDASPVQSSAAPASSIPNAPPEVLAEAAATGAINAGPAPDFADVPSHGSSPQVATSAEAVLSAGPAPAEQ